MRSPGHVISLLSLGGRGRDREGAATFLGREIVQRLQIVCGHTDDLRAGFLEVADRFAEGMRLGGAARSEGLREEVKDDWAFLHLLGQVDLELLAADCARRGKVRSLGANLERGGRGGS